MLPWSHKRQPRGKHTTKALMQLVSAQVNLEGVYPPQNTGPTQPAAAVEDQPDKGGQPRNPRPRPRPKTLKPDIIATIKDQFLSDGLDSTRILHNPQDVKELLSEVQKPETNVNKLNYLGDAPLHSLVKRKFVKEQLKFDLLISLLMYSDVDVNLPNGYGNTALHMAVEGADMKIIRLLLAFGANINALNSQNKTPLDLIQGPYRLFQRQESIVRTPEISAVLEEKLQDVTPNSPADQESLRPIYARRLSSLVVPAFTDVQDIGEFLKVHGAVRGREITKRHSFVANRSPVKKFAGDSLREKELMERNIAAVNVEKSTEHTFNDSWTAQIPSIYYQLAKATESGLIRLSLRQNLDGVVALGTQLKEMKMLREAGSRILFLDGGGMRGLIQIEILSQLEEQTGRRVTELFDWIVGTSTGGILALGLVYAKKTVKEMRQYYHKLKEEVLEKPRLGLAFNTKGFEAMLKDSFGNIRMNEVKYPRVLISAVNKASINLKLHFFNNCFDDEFSTEEVWKVARYTSSAPMSFTEMDNYVDGGVLANNPGSSGLTRIQDYYRNRKERLPISLVVSIGTGILPDKELGRSDAQDFFFFGKHWFNFSDTLSTRLGNLTTLLNQAITNSDESAENLRSRCQEQDISYYRFNPKLDTKIPMGETDNENLIDMVLLSKTIVTTQPNFSRLVLQFHQCSQASHKMSVRGQSKDD